jgi:steroid delta-isomerase-like uncharacterized protein
MTSDEIRGFLEGFVRAWERHDLQSLVSCYADDCVITSPIFHTITGRSQLERSYTDLFRAFTHQSIRVDDVVISDETPARAVIVWTVQSRHDGEIFGMPASGKRIERTVVFILTFRDGRIAKEVRIYDFTSMLMQLGVLRAKTA